MSHEGKRRYHPLGSALDSLIGSTPGIYFERSGNGGKGMWVAVDRYGDLCNCNNLEEALEELHRELDALLKERLEAGA